MRERASIRALKWDTAEIAHAESYCNTGHDLLEELFDYRTWREPNLEDRDPKIVERDMAFGWA